MLRPCDSVSRVDDRVTVDIADCGHDSIFQFLFGGDKAIAQDRAGKLGEEGGNHVGRRRRLSAVRGVIVEDEFDRRG